MPDVTMPGDGPVNFTNTKGLYQKRAVISGLGATRTLLASESGALVLLDKADGIVLTLPAASVGLTFELQVLTTLTSNAYKIITSAGTIFLTGGYISCDTDTTNAVAIFTGNGSTHVSISSNGSTTGGLIGTRLKLTCISATLWLVEGIMMGSGSVATAFATS